MVIDFHDVGHGSCVVVTSPEGKRLMIDCGHDSTLPWFPSIHYNGINIENLIVSNFDEDHLSDLEDLMKNVKLSFITRNNSVSSSVLRQMKNKYGMGPGIKRLCRWMESVEGKPSSDKSDQYGSVNVESFWNEYPNDFEDENNLSVISFVEYSGFRAVFTGDLEVAGWMKLLERDYICRKLKDVNVFVASHHGRDSGCCDDVFKICEPQIVLMSDKGKQFDTQNTTGWYKQRSSGIGYNGARRHVFTTRNDGAIRIDVGPSHWNISTQN